MTLLLQLHASLPQVFADHERRLYILICREKTCQRETGSIRAMRETRVLASPSEVKIGISLASAEPPSVHSGMGNALFGRKETTSLTKSENPFSIIPASGRSNLEALDSVSGSVRREIETQRSCCDTPCSRSNDLPETFAHKAKISSDAQLATDQGLTSSPQSTALPRPFPAYHLDADYEVLESSPTPSSRTRHLPEVGKPFDPASPGTEHADAFESTIDETFQRFADRLAQNAEQVLRYEYGGSPLLYSRIDSVGTLLSKQAGLGKAGTRGMAHVAGQTAFPACPHCSSQRVFELQMTPHAIAMVEAEEPGLDGMEWGTLIVAVCGNDCHGSVPVGETFYAEEWVGVQWEERRR